MGEGILRTGRAESPGGPAGNTGGRCGCHHRPPPECGRSGGAVGTDGDSAVLRAGSTAVRNQPLQGDGGTAGSAGAAAGGRYGDAGEYQ